MTTEAFSLTSDRTRLFIALHAIRRIAQGLTPQLQYKGDFSLRDVFVSLKDDGRRFEAPAEQLGIDRNATLGECVRSAAGRANITLDLPTATLADSIAAEVAASALRSASIAPAKR